MAFMAYVRSAGQVFGITVGYASPLAPFLFLPSPLTSAVLPLSSTILTNQLPKRLPSAFISQLASRGVPVGELAYAAIPFIAPLPEPLRDQVREAFALSIRTIWISMSAVVCIGLAANFWIKTYGLNMAMDGDWGLEREVVVKVVGGDGSEEKGGLAV
jgi:hypothetical protein